MCPNDPCVVPASFDYDPVSQTYIDRQTRPELTDMVYEFAAPMEYMVRPPQPLAILFLIDVSYTAITTGLVGIVARTIRESLDQIPNESGRTKVGFITFDSTIHFYCFPNSLAEPKMLIVPDAEDVFLPVEEDLLVSLGERKPMIEALLEKIPLSFANNS